MLQNQEIPLEEFFNLEAFCHEIIKYPRVCCKYFEMRT